MRNNIERFRKEKGWTQDDLAEKAFTTKSTVSRWENGGTEPDIASLKNLSRIFEKSIDEILDSSQEPLTKNKVEIKTKKFQKKLRTMRGWYSGFVEKNQDTSGKISGDAKRTITIISKWVIFASLGGLTILLMITMFNIFSDKTSSTSFFNTTNILGIVMFSLMVISAIVLFIFRFKGDKKIEFDSTVELFKKGITITKNGLEKSYPNNTIINLHQRTSVDNRSRTGWTLFGGMNTVNTVSNSRGRIEIWFDDSEMIVLPTSDPSMLELLKTLKSSF